MNDEKTAAGVLVFVDEIEEDEVAVLLGETRHLLPRALLPVGAKEGSWLRLTLAESSPTRAAIEAQRARLLKSDPGGKIKL